MKKLNYTLLSSREVADPKKRTMMLVGAAIEEVQTLRLLAQVLQEAETSALSIEDTRERDAALSAVHKVTKRLGFDAERNTFELPIV